MPRLYMITVPGLEVKSDWRIVHDRLLDDFPLVDDVLPTTTPETLLILRPKRLPTAGQALGQSLREFKGSLMGERIGGETLSVSHGSGTSSANYDDRPAPSDA
jgi:hypothetical protein